MNLNGQTTENKGLWVPADCEWIPSAWHWAVCLWQGLTGQHLGCSWTHFVDQDGSNSETQLFYTLEQEKSFREKLRGIWINSDFN